MLVITIINLLSNKYFPPMAKIIINTLMLTADYLLRAYHYNWIILSLKIKAYSWFNPFPEF
jgi:hypothetical protein